MNINPNDTFPRRNVPPEAVPWARAMEDHVIQDEKQLVALEQNAKSENRAIAAVNAELADQLNTLSDFLDELEGVLEDIQDLYESIPKVVQMSETHSGYGMASGWHTVETILVEPPEDVSRVAVTAFGSTLTLGSNNVNTLIGMRSRIIIAGVSSPTYWATTPMTTDGTIAIAAPQHGRTFNVSGPFEVILQLQASDPAEYPANPNNYAALAVVASFTG